MASFAVLFDMDGLMLDTERMARKAWTRALAENGYALEDADYLRIVGRTVQDAEMILKGFFGADMPFQAVFDLRQAYYEADIEANGIPLKPGLENLLAFLTIYQIPRAVASSTPGWFARHKLSVTKIDHHFQAVVCGDMVAAGKPAPDLFLEAARQIAIPPERCVVLEDSEAGILAAHAAGMTPVMIPDLKPPTPEIRGLAYRVLPSLEEVIPLMAEFSQDGLPA